MTKMITAREAYAIATKDDTFVPSEVNETRPSADGGSKREPLFSREEISDFIRKCAKAGMDYTLIRGLEEEQIEELKSLGYRIESFPRNTMGIIWNSPTEK